MVTEVSSSGGWNRGEVFAGGHHIATYSGGTSGTISFTHADWLGTERKRTDKNGASIETCTNLPFGDGQSCTGTDVSPLHFTGKQRDTETNNDDFGARYFNSGMARWLTPDWSARPEGVPYATLANPQTLNLYAYVGNNPVTHTDPDGHFSTWARRFGEAIQGKIEESGLEPIVGGDENTEEDRTNTQTQPAQAQNQPLTSVTVLGNTVGITYGAKLSAADQLTASNAIAAAAGLINKNASSLTADEKKAIGQISSFSVVGPKTALGATGKGSMTLSIGYIKATSSAWIGSLLGHEGQHYLNAGKYSGANLWRDEQSAGRMQLGIGNKIGFRANERISLENWIDDRNRAAMQRHMEQGYSY